MKKMVTGFAALGLVLGASVVALEGPDRRRAMCGTGSIPPTRPRRARRSIADKCATCHGADLNGAEMAPPLVGATFLGDWVGQSAGDLFTRIHTTMPANDPGSLSNAQAAQVLAYILSVNQFPAGSTALPSDDAGLGQIAITAEKPAK